jgi:hypothetical protein
MKAFCIVLFVCLGILDAAIIGVRVMFGTTQGQLLHGAGILVLPLYAMLLVAWGWILWLAPDVVKHGRPIARSQFLAVAILAVLPFLL